MDVDDIHYVVVMLYLSVSNVYPTETAGICDALIILLWYVFCIIYIHLLLFLMSIISKLILLKLQGSFLLAVGQFCTIPCLYNSEQTLFPQYIVI
jgi:hypothetical protein